MTKRVSKNQIHVNKDGLILFLSVQKEFMFYGYWKSVDIIEINKGVATVEIKKIAKFALGMN